MLLAYLDEVGETGAFISREHPRFNTSAAFGYAGFVIPAARAREFGARFTQEKRTLFQSEISQASHPGRWEKKGADMFRPLTPTRNAENLRVFDHLVRVLRNMGGQLFYYAAEKPLGTPKQTQLDQDGRESAAMQETLNRVARHADQCDLNVMVLIDQINEKSRIQRLPTMYSHIFGRASEYPEMRRIVEPPMHIDSQLSSNIQFADWVAACVGRAVDYQLVKDSRFRWITDSTSFKHVDGSFTWESKLHLHHRAVEEMHHSEIFNRFRKLYPVPHGQLIGSSIDPDAARKMHAIAAQRAATSTHRRIP